MAESKPHSGHATLSDGNVPESELGNVVSQKAATLVVAADDASDDMKNGADFVCSGSSDEVTILEAIESLPEVGGRVLLSEGVFNINDSEGIEIVDKENITLEGQGYSSKIISVDSGGNRTASYRL
ncbi:hypothetical protein [Salsuginibacillus kocurii]|uniref:hypothetical protein n=1 Tax=Salsuginibacillus kocurii TaxID=427078 RepID=UPI00036504E0|nr:hypothetical protein [Salsuginibacillus kocurii]